MMETPWAYRIAQHGTTNVSPYQLAYRHEAMLPIEVNIGSIKIAKQEGLTIADYHGAIIDNIEDIIEVRIKALEEMERNKRKVAKAYNKKVRAKFFQVNELVRKTILPNGTKSNQFSKWSPTWEGPYRIHWLVFGNSYILEAL